MFAITGITGNVGGQLASALLAAKLPVRAVVRDVRKVQQWAQLGCEVAQADINDPKALAAAFQGMEAVFILVPPTFDPAPDFAEARAVAASLRAAFQLGRPNRVVYLSTIGAQAVQTNLLSQHTLIENELRSLDIPITFLRPGWFMENAAWDVASARAGVIHSFLQPLDKSYSMVATQDIAQLAAQFLQETWQGHRTVELEGPARVTPNEIAATFAELLAHPVKIEIVARETWQQLFESQGMKNPNPRIRMLDGFNQGWIDFEGAPSTIRKGQVPLKAVLKTLLDQSSKG